MDPLTIAALASAGGGLVGGLLNKRKDESSRYAQQGADLISQVQTPDMDAMKVKLQDLVQQGIITPEDAQAALADPSAFNNISVDPNLRGAQMEALTGLQDVYRQGGLTAMDRARLQQIQDEQASFEKGQRGAITTDAARRGAGGSGIEMAAKLMAQQEGANRAGRAGIDVAALAQQRALDALMQSGQLGGQIEDRAYGQEASKATAADAIAKFNATNQQQVNLANTAARNSAQATNLGEKQRISDFNTAQTNTNAIRNADLLQQNYQNKMQKATSQANALNKVGSSMQAGADANFQKNAGIYSGLLNAGTTLGAASMNPQKPRNPDSTWYAAKGGRVPCYAEGGEVQEIPGKAAVPGDDYTNDTVPAMLSPGELVVPRTQADDVEEFMESMPRSKEKPTPEAVSLVLQALSEMGC